MNLMSKVVFEYNIVAGRISETASFKDLDELKQIIKGAPYQKPFTLHILRNVKIIDNDLRLVEKRIPWFVDPEHKDASIRAEIECEHLDLIVMDKLIYPDELRKNVAKKYANITGLDFPTRFEREPVKNFQIVEKYKGEKLSRFLYFSPLMPRDIVVDANLKQIWPEKTDVAPSALTNLLAKTKEIIH